jgi:cyanophycinase-like exopeptidase
MSGKVYLLGSSHGATLREALRRVGTEAKKPQRIAMSFAALQHTPTDALKQGLSLANLLGVPAMAERFSVAGEDDATPPEEARAVLDRADIVFFGGGDPVLAADRLVKAGADEWLRAARERGVTFIGLSAGSIALGAHWASWPEGGGEAALVPCVGVLPNVVVDCHSEEDDWDELRTVQKLLGTKAGTLKFAGIRHGAALIVDGAGAFEWMGDEHWLGA